MTHVCVSKQTIIGSDNGLSPGRHQAIIWNNAGILLIGPLGTKFNEILIEIHTFSFKEMHLKMSSGKWRPFCLGLNVLTQPYSLYAMISSVKYTVTSPGFCSFTLLCLDTVRLLQRTLPPSSAQANSAGNHVKKSRMILFLLRRRNQSPTSGCLWEILRVLAFLNGHSTLSQ